MNKLNKKLLIIIIILIILLILSIIAYGIVVKVTTTYAQDEWYKNRAVTDAGYHFYWQENGPDLLVYGYPEDYPE